MVVELIFSEFDSEDDIFDYCLKEDINNIIDVLNTVKIDEELKNELTQKLYSFVYSNKKSMGDVNTAMGFLIYNTHFYGILYHSMVYTGETQQNLTV